MVPSTNVDDEARQFLMGPIEKFLRHRRVPFKLITNVVLVILLTCLAQLYMAPLQAALGRERHTLAEAILTLPTDDGLPDSYQSKWHGDYTATPRVTAADVHHVAQYMLHASATLAARTNASTAMSVTFVASAAEGATANGGVPRNLSGWSVLWQRVGPFPDLPSTGNAELDAGLAVHDMFFESSDERVLAALRSLASSPVVACGSAVLTGDICDGPAGTKVMCGICVSGEWEDLRQDNEKRERFQRAWAGLRLVQRIETFHVSASWTSTAVTWQGRPTNLKTPQLSSEEPLQRFWDTRVSFTKVGGLSVRIEPVITCSTKRHGFFSSDDDLSLDDGFAIVSILVALNVLALLDVGLRLRALMTSRTQRAGVGATNRSFVAGNSDTDEEGATIMRDAEVVATEQRNDASDDDDAADSGAPMVQPHYQPTEWSLFLLQSKGRWWHVLAITADGMVLLFCVLTYLERAGLTMTFTRWSVLQLVFAAAVFGHCVGLVGFLRFTPRAYMLIRATQRASGRLLMMLLGILPVYVGFALLFFIAFGDKSSGEFETFSSSCMALVFMMFGDNLLPAFHLIDGSREWWMRAAADIAGCLYVVAFMGIVLNMSVATVVDTYKYVCREANIILLDEGALEGERTDEQQAEDELQREALILSLKEEVKAQLLMINQLQERQRRRTA